MLSPPHRCLQNRARLSSAGPKANVAPNAFTTLPLLSKSRGNAKEMRRALPCRLRDNFGFRKMSESAIENHKSSKARNSEATQMIAGCESAGPARPQPGGAAMCISHPAVAPKTARLCRIILSLLEVKVPQSTAFLKGPRTKLRLWSWLIGCSFDLLSAPRSNIPRKHKFQSICIPGQGRCGQQPAQIDW